MEQNAGIGRLHVVELGFNTTRMLFTFGNLAAIAIDAIGRFKRWIKAGTISCCSNPEYLMRALF